MNSNKVLFVEGPNDREVVYHIENEYGLRDVCVVEVAGSVDDAKERFALAINENASKYKQVGIVVDADEDMKARWQSIADILKETEHYDMVTDMPKDGLIVNPKPEFENKPIVGVWIMPNNSDRGMMEDFLMNLVEKEDTLMSKAEEALAALEGEGLQRYKAVHRSKAKVHTYLAWQEQPGLPLGQAVTKHYLNPTKEAAKKFADWMYNLFS